MEKDLLYVTCTWSIVHPIVNFRKQINAYMKRFLGISCNSDHALILPSEVSQSSVKTLQQVPVMATLEFNGLLYNLYCVYNCYKVVLIKHKHCTRSYDVTI